MFELYFVCFRLMYIKFIGLAFIDPETFPQLWLQLISRPYPTHTYVFAFLVGLGRLWQGFLFFWFQLLQSIHWLDSRQSLELLSIPLFPKLWDTELLCTEYAQKYWLTRVPVNLSPRRLSVDQWQTIWLESYLTRVTGVCPSTDAETIRLDS